MTVDVEDWFQVENFKQSIPYSSWSSYELRVEENTHRLLNLFDSLKPTRSTNSNNSQLTARNSIKATFFILGWIAERLPKLVTEIHAQGHEVASHGYDHSLCSQKTPSDLFKDLTYSKKLLEDITGHGVLGYRAPSFSISDDMLKIIKDVGYLYDSSFNSFDMHRRYGKVDFSRYEKRGVAVKLSNDFYEIPISNIRIGMITFPMGGGGYFRLIPFPLFRFGVKSSLRKWKTYVFYTHPWEVDPDQPRVKEASQMYRFRHYVNLGITESKLLKFMKSFQQGCFITCSQYIDELGW